MKGEWMETTNTPDIVELAPHVARAPRLLLRPEEGAEAIGVSRAKFYELMSRGEIRSIKVGRSRRVPLAELNAWIASTLAAQTA